MGPQSHNVLQSDNIVVFDTVEISATLIGVLQSYGREVAVMPSQANFGFFQLLTVEMIVVGLLGIQLAVADPGRPAGAPLVDTAQIPA